MESLLYQQLASILRRETEQYRALLEVLSEETDRLAANDTDGLLAVTRRKDTIALQIRSLEESRFLLMGKIARVLGREPEGLTVSEVCRSASREQADELGRVRDELRGMATRAAAMNDRNRVLADSSLGLLRGAMETIQTEIRSRMTTAQGYGPPRPAAPQPVGGMVVSRQV